jgi:hypothetical protein
MKKIRILVLIALSAVLVLGGCKKKEVTGISIEPATLTLSLGATQMLLATVTPADADDNTVTWSSSNPLVASVSAAGEVSALTLGMASITATAGSKTASCAVTVKNPDVYAIGNTGTGGILWKNGVGQRLGLLAANAVYVTIGGDVYVAGSIGEEYKYNDQAVLWKDGVIQKLADSAAGQSRCFAVFVSGSDVYAAGHIANKAVLWKNGVAQMLTSEITNGVNARSVFVSGSNVYVAGYIGNRAVLWKNGVEQMLTEVAAGVARGLSVFVSGSDVYVAGYIGDKAMLWKNGVAQTLSGKVANGVYVVGSTVYVAGIKVSDYGFEEGVVWKNGIASSLSFMMPCKANAVFVSNGDVYVAGSALYTDLALWKNGTALPLDGFGGGEATAVFVR